MNIAVITGYLRQLNIDGAPKSAKVRALMAQMPKEQRERIFGCPIPREEVVRRLRDLAIPDDLKGLLIYAWPENYCGTPPLEFSDAETIVDSIVTRPACFEPVIQAGFLPIGKAGNGDLVVTDFKLGSEYPVGFICHELLYSSDQMDVTAAYRPIESSLERFLFRCVNGLELPGDGFDEWSPSELTKPLKSKPWWKFWR